MINNDADVVRASATLTGSYVAQTDTLHYSETGDASQLVYLNNYTKGDETSASVKVEFSADKSTWYQETFSSISSGTDTLTLGEHTMSATGKYVLYVPSCMPFTRISCKATGGTPTGTMAISVQEGNA